MIPKYITVHASATPPGQFHNVASIRAMHLKRNFSDIGYHFLITSGGEIQPGRPITKTGAHVYGHNQDNIGVCMVGGVDKNNKPINNFTDAQFDALRYLISEQSGIYGIKQGNIKGHRDWSPDINGDGKITSIDWLKSCPCFDVQEKLKEWMA